MRILTPLLWLSRILTPLCGEEGGDGGESDGGVVDTDGASGEDEPGDIEIDFDTDDDTDDDIDDDTDNADSAGGEDEPGDTDDKTDIVAEWWDPKIKDQCEANVIFLWLMNIQIYLIMQITHEWMSEYI